MNCYTIAVGKNATASHTVLVGHNEDDWGDLIVNIYKVPPADHKAGEQITLLNGTKIPQVKHTNGFLWWETTQQQFGDYYLNQYGVSICSDACLSKEDTAKGNIGFYLRRIVAERAHTAKEGVEIAGKLISTLGYASSGRTYCIADPNEIWLLAAVQGHHWVAERVPSDSVAIVPNYYTIEHINLHDTADFLASPGLIQYAVLRGWYSPESGKAFNFKAVYSKTTNLFAFGNIVRHWSGVNALANRKFSLYSDLPFSFTPKKPMTIKDLQNVLSSHYEGTDFQTDYSLHKNPHRNLINRICNAGTKYSLVTQLYNNRLANDAYIVWYAPLNPCIHPYIPIVYGIEKIPEVYENHPVKDILKYCFAKQGNTFEENPQSAYGIFEKYNASVDADYLAQIKAAKAWKTSFEKEAQEAMAKAMMSKNGSPGMVSEKLMLKLYQAEKAKVQ
jgi:dipeptidase